MSISGKIAMGILRQIQPGKNSYGKSTPEKLREKARKENARFVFSLPKNRKADYHVLVGTEYPCLTIRPKYLKYAEKAVLYIYGGVTNNWSTQRSMAVQFALDTGVEVWYPVYPSITEAPVQKTVEYLYGIYRRMQESFEPDKITLCGVSMGGFFALELVNWINRMHPECPMPGLIIAHSAGGWPVKEADWDELRRYEKQDPLFSERDLRMTLKILADSESIPDWIMAPALGDFHRAPETWLYYGEEMLAGNAPAYRRAYERDGSGNKIHIEIVKNMMHGYSCMPVFPESKRSYRKTIVLIKELGTREDTI